MACSNTGSNVALTLVSTIVTVFEGSIVPALEAVGKLSPAIGTAIGNYVNLAVGTITTVETDIKTGTSTPTKIGAVLQTLVTAFDSVASVVPNGTALSFWLTVANGLIQSLLNVLAGESARTTVPVATAAIAHTAIAAHVTDSEPLHPTMIEKWKFGHEKDRMLAVQKKMHQILTADA